MQNHRISTTISEKHWELLKKHADKLETQQKALELALESLENSKKQSPTLTEEEKIWMRLLRTKSSVPIEKAAFKLLIEPVDIEQLNKLIIRDKPIEYAMEYCFQKPLQECSLKEIMDELVMIFEVTNWFDTVDYTDDGGYYTLKITSSLGFTVSKVAVMSIENALKAYGVKVESIISSKMVFMKIFKN